ncbi:MAG: glutaredoxin 3 [Xanthomonadales bacterium]|nr:glutaredoxin 3 [Xanthomonadales bacterium]
MSKILMYTTGYCPYCLAAKSLLVGKGVSFDEIRVDQEPALRQEMEQRSQRRTVPQIFIGETHVGGFDELSGLERSGELDSLLAES